ncbi:type II secretion system secretin GspD [Thermodesulfobacteriota bacterium]
MQHEIRRLTPCILLALALYLFSVYPVQGARLSGDKEITPVAPKVIPRSRRYPPRRPAVKPPVRSRPASGKEKIPPREVVKGEDTPPKETVKSEERASKEAGTEPRYVTIDFDNVDIALFIKFISELTSKNFVIDTAVKGKVSIISPRKITIDEAYRVFESVLEVHGFTTVPAGSIIKIVPAIQARSKDIETRLQREAISPEDKVVTQLIPLKYADPDELKKVFGPFISKNSVMVSYRPTGMLIVSDVLSNIGRLLKIVDVIDVEGTGEEISIIPLEHATATVMAKSLNTVFKKTVSSAKKGAQSVSAIRIVPDERTNTLIILASEIDTFKIRQLIQLLDRETPKGEGDIRVYYLQNANAEDLSKVLMSIPSKQKEEKQKGKAPVLSKEVQIMADKATNSLIITAKKEDYLVLEEVIKKLDIPRRMVYIEALIMEVSVSKQFDLGVQWLGGKPAGEIRGRDIGVFGGSTPPSSILPSANTTTGAVSLPAGFTLGVLGDVITIGGIQFPNLGAVIRAYSTHSDVHILSTPQIMTTDNEEAEIIVADNIPFLTRRDETQSGTDYSNYEFKDVGVTLNIIPQINQERFVRLKISQEVSQVVNQEEIGLPTTLKRIAKTTVVIKDGQTVVIGGLIDETGNRSTYKVPLLGDIPVLGWLFRSNSDSNVQKNLYIFLTPHIVENPTEAKAIYEDKKGHIDTIKEGVIKMYDGRHGQPKDMRLSDLGFLHLQAKEYDKALEYYEKSIEINPENPYAILNMGFIYEKRGDKDKAAEMYNRLITLNPDERAFNSTDPMQKGRKLTDIAGDNLKNLENSQQRR